MDNHISVLIPGIVILYFDLYYRNDLGDPLWFLDEKVPVLGKTNLGNELF